ncbi:TPR-like protein [Cantharellus anzutake]|uniref:TPR-like protein n=1 Tax=Cantharellus anzutake TaxID=1750568 RepID=UPI0019078F42|nr:TPR-like protein [Cantharellus anzutake]KAF8339849.1 TPR-like protein [Cantharellus anzutake]
MSMISKYSHHFEISILLCRSMSEPPTNEFSSVEEKMEVAQGHKEKGDKAFRSGDWKAALQSYHLALLYLTGLDKRGLPAIPKEIAESVDPDEAKTLTQNVRLNMAACHLKTDNFKRALYYADEVLKKNPTNTKALFRRAKSLSSTGYTEKAIKILEDLVAKNPDDSTFTSELAAARAKEKEADVKSYKKFKGFLSKDKGEKPETS